MKNLSLFISSALLVLLFAIGCTNKSEKTAQSIVQTVTPVKVPAKTDIMKEWLVSEALKGLPERNCLRYRSYEDSTNVTIMFTDTCSRKTDILYLNMPALGGEVISFDRRYPNGKKLILMFSYQGDKFSVQGSQIVSAKDTVILDQVAIATIVHSNYRI